MIEAVYIFALLNMAVELVLIAMMPARVKLRLLGSDKAMMFFHLVVGGLTLRVHFGSATGTGSAFVAFLGSFPALWIAKQIIFGYVTDGVYHRRLLGYTKEELK